MIRNLFGRTGGSIFRGAVLMAVLLAGLTLSSCRNKGGGEDEGPRGEWEYEGSVVGSWHLTSWSNLSAGDVWISFSGDGSFDLYQRLYYVYYEHLTGSWSLSGGVLSGSYSDGSAWAGAYEVAFNSAGQMRLMIDQEDVSIFTSEDIPAEILDGTFAPSE